MSVVHVYILPLKVSDDQRYRACVENLSMHDGETSSEFKRSKSAAQYPVSRFLIRYLLSSKLGVACKDLEFEVNEYGKPHCLQAKRQNIFYNTSHSHELLAIAVSSRCEIGLDIEYLARKNNIENIAKEMFSEEENVWMLQNSELLRDRFFELWTHKEAYIKANGVGIAGHLSDIVFEEVIDVGLQIKGQELEWAFSKFEPAKGYVGAVAMSGTEFEVETVDLLWEDIFTF